MTAIIIPFRRQLAVPGYFGGCPVCGQDNGFLNLGREHWFVCHRHGVKWCIGSNLFSSWRYETELDRRESAQTLAGYREVEPLPCNAEGHDRGHDGGGDGAGHGGGAA